MPLACALVGAAPRAVPSCGQSRIDEAHVALEPHVLLADLVCDLAGVPAASDHRQVLRSFINMMFWGAIAIGAALWVAL